MNNVSNNDMVCFKRSEPGEELADHSHRYSYIMASMHEAIGATMNKLVTTDGVVPIAVRLNVSLNNRNWTKPPTVTVRGTVTCQVIHSQ